jgi:hypothetical protein
MLSIVTDLRAKLKAAVTAGPEFGPVLAISNQLLALQEDTDVSSTTRGLIISDAIAAVNAVLRTTYYASNELSVSERTIVIALLQRIAEAAVPGISFADNAGSRSSSSSGASSSLVQLSDANTMILWRTLRACVPTMLTDRDRFGEVSSAAPPAATAPTRTAAPSTSAAAQGSSGSQAAASAAASSAVLRSKATVRQRIAIHREGPSLLQLLNWIGRAADTAAAFADLADALASESSLATSTTETAGFTTPTTGDGPTLFYQRALMLHRGALASLSPPSGPLSAVRFSLPSSVITTVTGSLAVLRASGLVYSFDHPPHNTTVGLSLLNGSLASTTAMPAGGFVALSPVVRVQLLVEEDANPVMLSSDGALAVAFEFLSGRVPDYFFTQNVSCVELAVAGNGTELTPPVPVAARVLDEYEDFGDVFAPRWIDSGRPVLTGTGSRIATCQAYAAVRGYASYVMLVARDPVIFVTTPAPTKRALLASLSNLAASVSPAAWAAVGLGSVLLLLAMAYGVYWWRTRGGAAEEQEEAKEKTQVLLIADLVHDDPQLRAALEIARARRLYVADL